MPRGSRVLMADDDKMLIDMYKERLELAGYSVILCRNGEEALAQAKTQKPDIILLDVMMPKANGYEVLASLKSDPESKDIPVVMLSALMRDFNREKAIEAGADDYLIKSEAMPSDVITKIEQVLQKYGKGIAHSSGGMMELKHDPNLGTQSNVTVANGDHEEAKKENQPPVSGLTDYKPEENKKPDIFEKSDLTKTEPNQVPATVKSPEPAKLETSDETSHKFESFGTELKDSESSAPKPAEEEVPIITFQPEDKIETAPPPPMPVPPKPPIAPTKPANALAAPVAAPPTEKGRSSSVLLIIMVILLAILANNLIIYFFFLRK